MVNSGFLGILIVRTRKIVMLGYILWFSRHITGKNTVKSNACVHLVVFYA